MLSCGVLLAQCTDARPIPPRQDANALCYDCHGTLGGGNPAPPPVSWADDYVTDAHQSHLRASSEHRAIACTACHSVPDRVLDPGHIDTPPPAELVWGELAGADGATPTLDGGRCMNVYCHGATLTRGGGQHTAPTWSPVGDGQAACGACHGVPPPAPHVQRSDCTRCHGVGPEDGVFVAREQHVDGMLDLVADLACNTCHGGGDDPSDVASWAPPVDVDGNELATARGVGAHQSHLRRADWRAAIACADCHRVPPRVDAVGHADTTLPAELTWSALAAGGSGRTPTFDGSRCTNVYCHGAQLQLGGGAHTEPLWTQVDGTQSGCGSCHGDPPPRPHVAVTNGECGPCHDFSGRQPNSPGTHIDGTVDVERACGGACHPVPPTSGAHARHFADSATAGFPRPAVVYGDLRVARDFFARPIEHYFFGCGHCHALDPARHMNGTVDVELYDPGAPAGTLKARMPDTATWDGDTCADVVCHSNAIESPTYRSTPRWNGGKLAEPRCTACHPSPPSTGSHLRHAGDGSITMIHNRRYACPLCHDGIVSGTALGDYTITDTTRHVSGTVDWSFDDADPRLAGGESYSIASGTQRPSDGSTSRTYGTCGDVYCHSNVQPDGGVGAPDVYTSPRWGTVTTCTGCHVPEPSVSHAGSMRSGSHSAHLYPNAPSSALCLQCHNWDNAGGFQPGCAWAQCHTMAAGAGENELALHADGSVNVVVAPGLLGAGGGYNGSALPGDGYGSCSNVYCHSTGESVRTAVIPANTTATWGDDASLGCNACHGNSTRPPPNDGMPDYPSGAPKENSHRHHVIDRGLSCRHCHAATTLDGRTVLDQVVHVNGVYSLVPGGDYAGRPVSFTYASASPTGAGSCASISCHTDAPASAVWGGP